MARENVGKTQRANLFISSLIETIDNPHKRRDSHILGTPISINGHTRLARIDTAVGNMEVLNIQCFGRMPYIIREKLPSTVEKLVT